MREGGNPANTRPNEDRERYLASLRQSEWLSEHDLELYQRRLLERIVRHASAETDYYRDALKVLFNADGAIDWRRWQDVPVLTREDVQSNPELLIARSVPDAAGGNSEIRTSGSTSLPIRVLWDQLTGFAMHTLDARFYGWHGIDISQSLALIRAFPEGENMFPGGGRSRAWHALGPDADFFKLNSTTALSDQIEWLEHCRPDYLSSYASNIIELAMTMDPGQARGLGLKACMSFGETVSDEAHEIVRERFGAPLLDRYGVTEVGQISAQCPMSTRHHVSMEAVRVEFLDDGGQPVKPGERGRVIVTGFYNYSMPFIRYDVGDYAIQSAKPCACGRRLAGIERIVGRARSIFRFNDGSARFPYIKLREIAPFLPHRQLQVAQTQLDRIEVRYVPDGPDHEIDKVGLTAFFRQRLHESLTVELRAMERIPRSRSGKFFDYVSELRR